MLWVILLLIVVASLAVAFVPWFKSYRTIAFSALTATWATVFPLLGDIFTYLKDLDWQQYVNPDQAPWIILAVTLMYIILRFRTTTPVGLTVTKEK